MQTQVGQIWSIASRAARRKADDFMGVVKSICQSNYMEICRKHDWDLLRRTTSLTFAVTDTTGLLLPADLIGITLVYNADDPARIYWPIQHKEKSTEETRYRWMYADAATTPLEDRFGVAIDTGSKNFTITPAMSDPRIGEYIQFGETSGIYKISAALTLETPYRGPTLTGPMNHFYVRPPSTKRMILCDDAGDLVADTVTVHYWIMPEPLYDAYQLIMLPTHKPLELITVAEVLALVEDSEKKADNYRRQYDAALSEMIRINKHIPRTSAPRKIPVIGQNYYTAAKGIHESN